MLLNYLKIAIRHLIKNKTTSIINISGLALGIATFLLILEFVSLEKSVNQFHKNLPNMYRMLCQSPDGNNWPQVEPGWADKMIAQFPEIKSYCRFEQGSSQGIVQNKEQNLSFREQQIGYVEGNFFEFFSFPLVEGKAADFNQPFIVFLSESSAKKYFPQGENPIGRKLDLNNQFGSKPYSVKGIYKNIGDNSDIKYDMVFSLETLKNKANLNGNGWADLDNLDNQFINTFFELSPNIDFKSLETKLSKFRRDIQVEKDAVSFRLQPVKDIHLASSSADDLQHTGNTRYVIMLLTIAFSILIIAWFNYINLTTANALKRSNEVGVRKVIGASRSDLLSLFMTESLLVNILAFVLGIFLVFLIQPLFNTMIGKNMHFDSLFLNPIWLVGLSAVLLGSILSGLYAAFSLSHFRPIEILKGKLMKLSGGSFLRKSMVVAQFSISVVLIVCTILVYYQLQYMQNENLGFASKQLMIIPAPDLGIDSTFKTRKNAYFNDVIQLSYVKDHCTSGTFPGRGYNFATNGFTTSKSKPGAEEISYSFSIIGDKFLPVYEIPLSAGRNFSHAETTVEWNDNDKIIINEKAARDLGHENPAEIVNTKVKWDERYLQVIGVVKDYHHDGLQQMIKPIIFYPSQVNDLTLKLTPGNMQDKIAALEKLYNKYFTGNPFEYYFIDDYYNRQYASEKQFGQLFTSAALLAILIACMGLLGLTIYTVESRTKEIGIRKVLGASVQGITSLISKDFIKLVFIGIIIASPIAYYFMNKWLADFAYRIDIEWWVFVLAGVIAVGIALFTISFQSIKAAVANPVKSLRSE